MFTKDAERPHIEYDVKQEKKKSVVQTDVLIIFFSGGTDMHKLCLSCRHRKCLIWNKQLESSQEWFSLCLVVEHVSL